MSSSAETTELGREYAARTKQLITIIDDIRALGGQGLIDLPRIAVIGNQSAGKSSLIEAISGITVPRAIGTCTRCPMECRLQQRPGVEWHAQVYLRIETDALGNRLRDIYERPFGDPLTSKEELETMLRRAQLAALNPTVGIEHFVGLKVAADGKNDGAYDKSKQLAFSSNVVCVTVWGPDVPDLSFIDLPGIIQNEVEPGSMEAVKGMVMKHIQGNCLILLAITMRDDIENQNAAYLARQVDPEGKRTVGVLTKPDTLQAGEEHAWREILEGRKHPLREGYFITKQPAPKDVEDKISHQAARDAERLFFENHSIWSACSAAVHARMGTAKLGQALSRLLSKLIDQTLPALRQDVQEQQARTKSALDALPEKLSQPAPVKLLQLITAYTTELDAFVRGDQHHRELHQSAIPAFRAFRLNVRRTAPNLVPKTRADHEKEEKATKTVAFVNGVLHESVSATAGEESDYSDDDEVSTKPKKVHASGPPIFLDDIRQTVQSHVTKELPFNVPFSAKLDVIALTFKAWPGLADACADAVVKSCTLLCLKVADKVFGTFQYGRLDRAVRAITEDEIAKLSTNLKSRLAWLIEMEDDPYTQNVHYFSSYRSKYLGKYKGKRRPPPAFAFGAGTANGAAADHDSNIKELIRLARAEGYDVNSKEDLERLRADDMYEAELIVAAEVRAYFQVAYKRIIDEVPRVIHGMLIRQLRPTLESAIQSRFFTEDGLPAKLLAEDPDTTSRREDLETKTARLAQIGFKLDFSFTQA